MLDETPKNNLKHRKKLLKNYENKIRLDFRMTSNELCLRVLRLIEIGD